MPAACEGFGLASLPGCGVFGGRDPVVSSLRSSTTGYRLGSLRLREGRRTAARHPGGMGAGCWCGSPNHSGGMGAERWCGSPSHPGEMGAERWCGSPSHPGGMGACSRRLSVATPPVSRRKIEPHPGGMPAGRGRPSDRRGGADGPPAAVRGFLRWFYSWVQSPAPTG